MARHELYLCAHLRAAWTDVGGVGVVRRPILRKIVKFSQGLVHLRLEHVANAIKPACADARALVFKLYGKV